MSIRTQSDLLDVLSQWKALGIPLNERSTPAVDAGSDAYYLLLRILAQQNAPQSDELNSVATQSNLCEERCPGRFPTRRDLLDYLGDFEELPKDIGNVIPADGPCWWENLIRDLYTDMHRLGIVWTPGPPYPRMTLQECEDEFLRIRNRLRADLEQEAQRDRTGPPPVETERAEGGPPTPQPNRPRCDPDQPSKNRHDDILVTIRAEGTPLTRPELIERMRLKTEGKLGGHLAWMVRNGILVNIPQRGYWPASDPIPD